jgi:hypothetical protein
MMCDPGPTTCDAVNLLNINRINVQLLVLYQTLVRLRSADCKQLAVQPLVSFLQAARLTLTCLLTLPGPPVGKAPPKGPAALQQAVQALLTAGTSAIVYALAPASDSSSGVPSSAESFPTGSQLSLPVDQAKQAMKLDALSSLTTPAFNGPRSYFLLSDDALSHMVAAGGRSTGMQSQMAMGGKVRAQPTPPHGPLRAVACLGAAALSGNEVC